MHNRKLKRLVVSALLAAVYTVMALSLPMASFSAVQFRYAEALTLLPVFSPVAGIGVTLGCLLTNTIGFLMGVTFPQDILFGTLATLLGCVFTYLFRNIRFKGLPILSALAPVVCNTLIIGWLPPAWCWVCCWLRCWSAPDCPGISRSCSLRLVNPVFA